MDVGLHRGSVSTLLSNDRTATAATHRHQSHGGHADGKVARRGGAASLVGRLCKPALQCQDEAGPPNHLVLCQNGSHRHHGRQAAGDISSGAVVLGRLDVGDYEVGTPHVLALGGHGCGGSGTSAAGVKIRPTAKGCWRWVSGVVRMTEDGRFGKVRVKVEQGAARVRARQKSRKGLAWVGAPTRLDQQLAGRRPTKTVICARRQACLRPALRGMQAGFTMLRQS